MPSEFLIQTYQFKTRVWRQHSIHNNIKGLLKTLGELPQSECWRILFYPKGTPLPPIIFIARRKHCTEWRDLQ